MSAGCRIKVRRFGQVGESAIRVRRSPAVEAGFEDWACLLAAGSGFEDSGKSAGVRSGFEDFEILPLPKPATHELAKK